MDLLDAVRNVLSKRNIGKALLVVGLAVAVYQVYSKWRARRLLRQKVRGRVVLITGASSGLGEALARLFYSLGSKVILASRNTQQLDRIKFQLDNEHAHKPPDAVERHSPRILTLDLCDSTSLADKAKEAISIFGRVDVLINNAGVSSRGAGLDTTIETDKKVMEVNFFGTTAFTKGILPDMVDRGSGHIVVISSLQGKVGIPMRSSYAASKHALQGYFDCLRLEVASRGVKVTVVSPGYIKTQLSLNALSGDGTRHGVLDHNTAKGMSPELVAKEIVMAIACEKRDLIVASPIHRLAVYMSALVPGLLDWALQIRAKHQT